MMGSLSGLLYGGIHEKHIASGHNGEGALA